MNDLGVKVVYSYKNIDKNNHLYGILQEGVKTFDDYKTALDFTRRIKYIQENYGIKVIGTPYIGD